MQTKTYSLTAIN